MADKFSTTTKNTGTTIKRPPVIAIMGHIDHGKSTLLDYIRSSNVASKEIGGITQHIGSYEAVHKSKDGTENRITFLDTPGHEAFTAIRSRGARAADIAVLVVSGEEGVKPQTVEAANCIKEANIPYIIAITKIDSPKADIERTKQSLAEHEIYVEGYGGDVPWTAISAKTGEGISDLLDLLLLASDIADIKADTDAKPEGVVVESHLDKREGITAMVIIKNGTIKTGQVVVAGKSYAVIRNLKSFDGKKINQATFSSPVRIYGWSELPDAGMPFEVHDDKKTALSQIARRIDHTKHSETTEKDHKEKKVLNLVIKADTFGSLEAIVNEINKIADDTVSLNITHADVGEFSLNDVKKAEGMNEVLVIGFNTRIDPQATRYAERINVEIMSFEIIYKLVEWLKATVEERKPKIDVEETRSSAKVLKVFSRNRDKQIIGGRVEEGSVFLGEDVKIKRSDAEIGKGKIKELQQQKIKATEAKKDTEFGALIQCPIEIVPGDRIEGFKTVAK